MANAPPRVTSKKKQLDAFYESLTLGVSRVLLGMSRITDVKIEKRDACEKAQIITWEQRHGVYLPEDMKKFYLCADGFYLHWSFRYTAKDTRRVGFINIPRLIQITLLRELGQIVAKYSAASGTTLNRKMSAISINALSNTVYKNVNNNITATVSATNLPTNPLLSPRSKTTTSANELVIGPKTKIFEWNVLNGKAKVCMLYETLGSNNPKFYLIDLSDYKFILLADTFTEYLRMAIVHLGLPYWELLFSSITLPAWVEQLYLLVAPHLIEDRHARRLRLIEPELEQPITIIDPNVFRQKIKNSNAAKSP